MARYVWTGEETEVFLYLIKEKNITAILETTEKCLLITVIAAVATEMIDPARKMFGVSMSAFMLFFRVPQVESREILRELRLKRKTHSMETPASRKTTLSKL